MENTKEEHRSFKQHESPKIRTSQIVIVVVLVLGILVALVFALPNSWKQVRDKDTTSFIETLVTETDETNDSVFDEMQELFARIETLNSIAPDTKTAEEIALEPVATTSTAVEQTKYVNYDWNVSFTLPYGWSYDSAREQFTDGTRELTLSRSIEFIVPDEWEFEEGGDIPHFIEEAHDTVLHHYTLTKEEVTFIFTTSESALFSEEEAIITSLTIL